MTLFCSFIQHLIFSSNSDGYGSFVRPHKLNLGIDIIDAIQKRYASFSDEVKEEDLYLFGTGHQKVVIEAVGFDKVQEKQRYNLSVLSNFLLQASAILCIVLLFKNVV